jgi:hypothetical protein
MKKLTVLIIIALCAITPARLLYADSPATDESFSRYQADEDMRILRPAAHPFTPSYGGWVSPVYIDEKSGTSDNPRELGLAVVTTRLWLKASLWGNSFIYLRGRHVYERAVVEEVINIDDTNSLFDLDLGFIKIGNDSDTLQLFMGRKFFLIGTGLVMNGRADGAELNIYSRYGDLALFGAYSGLLKKDNNPYNLSTRDFSDGARRVFAGGTLTWSFANQSLYFLGMAQIDRADEDDAVKTRYQSQYYGAGLNGVLVGTMRYYAEWVYETGTSYTSKSVKSDIVAHAGNFGVDYYFPVTVRPALLFQYAYGSGDPDKKNYTSPTGNIAGEDNGFLSFGTFTGGYGLRPVLANIHILRAGFSLSPFRGTGVDALRQISFLFKYSYYMKYESSQTINYGEAPFDNSDLGHGLDTVLRWRIFSDVSFFANYAIFIPGAAYAANEEMRHFIMGGMNLFF